MSSRLTSIKATRRKESISWLSATGARKNRLTFCPTERKRWSNAIFNNTGQPWILWWWIWALRLKLPSGKPSSSLPAASIFADTSTGHCRCVQKNWNDYDRKKGKRMRYVFYKNSEKLTEEDRWYLKRYLENEKIVYSWPKLSANKTYPAKRRINKKAYWI